MDEFLIDKRQVRRAFNRAAASYDAAAVLQREVCMRMLERLEYIKLQPVRILDAGCGTGWGTRQLAQRYPNAQVVALDIAIGMLQAARGRREPLIQSFTSRVADQIAMIARSATKVVARTTMPRSATPRVRDLVATEGAGFAGGLLRSAPCEGERPFAASHALHPIPQNQARDHAGLDQRFLSWWQKLFGGAKQVQVCSDVEALPLAANSVEMAWSNLTVQWCNDLPATFVELHRVLKVDGLLMFSTFGPDTLKELRLAFNGVDRHNHLNRFADMHDIGDMLMHSGFAEPVMDMESLTLTYDDVRGVLQDLKTIGAHNATAGRGQGLMGKNAWARFIENYERLRRNGKLPATFEVVYGHAWKPQPRTTKDGAAIIQTSFKLK